MIPDLFYKYLFTFFLSMLPLIEIRGAVVYALGWNVPFWPALCLALVGNILPVPVIFFLARKVLIWGSSLPAPKLARFFQFFLDRGAAAGRKLQRDKKGIYWALFLFIGIPIPGTGAWTGTLAASLLDLDFKETCIAALGGILLAAFLMSLGTLGVVRIFS